MLGMGFEFQKQTPMLNIDEIISTLGHKTNWLQWDEIEEILEQAPAFTVSVR